MPAFRIGDKLILFIHIPKAGGTSIKSWLASHAPENLYQKHRPEIFPCVPQHFHGEVLDTLFAPGFFDYSFCVTRNPYDRILSEYNYRINIPRLKNRLLPKPSFERWLKSALSTFKKNGYVHSNHVRPQHEFLIEDTETFRLEDGLGPLQARLTALTGIPLEEQIPTKNPSIKSETKISEYEAGLIREFYADDFERFGYDLESWRELAA
ncbi:MAG: sulfotransferase family 2 domain-containing protein [Pseudomonadota bacterium]